MIAPAGGELSASALATREETNNARMERIAGDVEQQRPTPFSVYNVVRSCHTTQHGPRKSCATFDKVAFILLLGDIFPEYSQVCILTSGGTLRNNSSMGDVTAHGGPLGVFAHPP